MDIKNITYIENSVIQCSVGYKTPIYLCSLLPNKIESCSLNLMFDFDDESVEFSVTGDRSIHLSGFLEEHEHHYEMDDDDDLYPNLLLLANLTFLLISYRVFIATHY